VTTSKEHDHEALLQSYVEQHLAGAAGGISHIERMAELDADGETGRTLSVLAEQIRGEREQLRMLAELVGASSNPTVKEGVAWLAEKLARVAIDPGVGSRSPLGRVLDLELMMSAVAGKRAGWQTLSIVAEHDPRLPKTAIEHNIQQSTAQIDTLLDLHRSAARLAFTDPRAEAPQAANG
jgi:UDP-glucose 4-epimerase